MAYFLVLPVFALWLVVPASAVLIARGVPTFAPLYPYVWRLSAWATAGFLIANVALIIAVALGFLAIQGSSGPSATRDTVQISLGVAAIVGPFVVSAVGWLFGAIVGLTLAHRSLRHA